MTYMQFICHQLVRMLAVRLAHVLVKQDAMAYGKASIHAIDQQEYEICHVSRSENERAYEEEQDICHSEGTRCYGSRRRLVGFVYDVAFVRNAEIHQFGCKKQGRDLQIFKPSSHISVKIIQFDRLFYSTIPKCHFTTYYRCIYQNPQWEDNFPCS